MSSYGHVGKTRSGGRHGVPHDAQQWRWSCGHCKRIHDSSHKWCTCGKCSSWQWVLRPISAVAPAAPPWKQQPEVLSPSWAQLVAGSASQVADAKPKAGDSLGDKQLQANIVMLEQMSKAMAAKGLIFGRSGQPADGAEGGTAGPKAEEGAGKQDASREAAGIAGKPDAADGSAVPKHSDDTSAAKARLLADATAVFGPDCKIARDLQAAAAEEEAKVEKQATKPLADRMLHQSRKVKTWTAKRCKQSSVVEELRVEAAKALGKLHEAEQRLAEVETRLEQEQTLHKELAAQVAPPHPGAGADGQLDGGGGLWKALGLTQPVPQQLQDKLKQLHELANELRASVQPPAAGEAGTKRARGDKPSGADDEDEGMESDRDSEDDDDGIGGARENKRPKGQAEGQSEEAACSSASVQHQG